VQAPSSATNAPTTRRGDARLILEVDHQGQRIERFDAAIDQAVDAAPVQLKAIVDALQALRGVAAAFETLGPPTTQVTRQESRAVCTLEYGHRTALEFGTAERVGIYDAFG